MALASRQDYIKLIEQDYFANLVQENISAAIACFSDDARISVRHGDAPVRRFSVNGDDDTTSLWDFYAHLCGNYHIWFGEFTHYIDEAESRTASTFRAVLNPKPDSPYHSTGTQTLFNCNFFQFSDGRIVNMTIYYSNPNSDQQAAISTQSVPTGYPPQGK